MFKAILTGAIVLAFALTCWAVETWTDRRFPHFSDFVFLMVMTGAVGLVILVAYLHFGRIV